MQAEGLMPAIITPLFWYTERQEKYKHTHSHVWFQHSWSFQSDPVGQAWLCRSQCSSHFWGVSVTGQKVPEMLMELGWWNCAMSPPSRTFCLWTCWSAGVVWVLSGSSMSSHLWVVVCDVLTVQQVSAEKGFSPHDPTEIGGLEKG